MTTKYKGYKIEKAGRRYRVRGIRDSFNPMIGGADWETFPSLTKARAFINRNGVRKSKITLDVLTRTVAPCDHEEFFDAPCGVHYCCKCGAEITVKCDGTRCDVCAPLICELCRCFPCECHLMMPTAGTNDSK